MLKFTLILMVIPIVITLAAVLWFLIINKDKKNSFFYKRKLQRFNELKDNIEKNLKLGKEISTEDIEKFELMIENNDMLKREYYVFAKKLRESNIKEEIIFKFFNEINSKIQNNEDMAFENLYSKGLENFIIMTNSSWIGNDKVDEFLIKCFNNSSKKIRLEAFNALSNRQNIKYFSMALVLAGDKLSDFSKDEIFENLDKFKNRRLLNTIINKLKDESDNIRLKDIMEKYLA